MHSTETRIKPLTENNLALIKTGPSFGTQVEGDVRLQANRILGIGLQLSKAISMEAGAHGCVYPEKSPCELSEAISAEACVHACGYLQKR